MPFQPPLLFNKRSSFSKNSFLKLFQSFKQFQRNRTDYSLISWTVIMPIMNKMPKFGDDSICPALGMVRSKMKVFINTLNVGKCKFLGLKAVSFLIRYLLWRTDCRGTSHVLN